MEYIKRGEVPPELKNSNTGGRQVEVKNQNSNHWFCHLKLLVLGTS